MSADDRPIPQRGPYVRDEQAGTQAWCACGQSKSQPFCDGSHRGSAYRPVVAAIDSAKRVAWCGCKRTGAPPYCDGSHARLPAKLA